MKKIDGELLIKHLKQAYTPKDKFSISDLEFFIKLEKEIYDGETSAWINKSDSDKKICFICRGEADKAYKFCPNCGRGMFATLGDREDDPGYVK